jgi:hypothetical protein
MRSPLTIGIDWSRKRALKAQLLQALDRVRPGSPGGVELPSDDPLYAAAAQELLAKNPDLRIIRAKTTLTLTRASGISAGASAGLVEQLQSDGVIVMPGERLYDDR